MANITAAEVNKLRQQTGAGMMDCKKALVEAEGDFEAAVDILRKKGQKIAANRADRTASEGCALAATSSDNTFGAIVAIGCETDFVAKNEGFINLTQSILDIAMANRPADAEALKALPKEKQNRAGGSHQGTDVGAEKGTPAYPMLSGVVSRIYNWKKGDPAKQGNMIVVKHPEYNAETKYMHMDSLTASPGQHVDQNTQIATVGDSGNAAGTYPHIHFELLVNNTHVNARPYIEGTKKLERKIIDKNARKKILNKIINYIKKV
jgi:hypothetical protein